MFKPTKPQHITNKAYVDANAGDGAPSGMLHYDDDELVYYDKQENRIRVTFDIFDDYFLNNGCLPVVFWQYDLQHACYYHIVSYNTERIFAITAHENEGSTPILEGEYFNFCQEEE